MLAIQLAYKNLVNAGLRTWLNVGVLSFVFIVVLFYKGFIEGWNQDAVLQNIDWEYANGQVHHPTYEPADFLSIQDAHGQLVDAKDQGLIPVLVRQASIYPDGRLMNVTVKGIEAHQNVVKIPTPSFTSDNKLQAIIGKRMAKAAQLKIGDDVLMRWRDKNGTFDAGNITIVDIFDTHVPTVDQGQIWMPIDVIWEITGLENEATYYLVGKQNKNPSTGNWKFHSQDDLLEEIRALIAIESFSGSIIYGILLSIALLAIFDTQVLSIFRRQKEIGTCIALGMTRQQVMVLFTVEGAMYSIFAMIMGSIVGIPFLLYVSGIGIHIGGISSEMGFTMGETIYPVFNIYLLFTTAFLIVGSATVVSFLPAQKISKMNPVLAIKGKQQ
ncbi:MAG: FtsX-like permease family protein [Flammeovirgaceae bacterium]|nr:FtsX-like permease family protein [Flammeovirgaceae bacterium]